MIDKSTYCVFYFNKNYVASLNSKSKRNLLTNLERRSGTKIAYQYAVKAKKEIINLYNEKLDC